MGLKDLFSKKKKNNDSLELNELTTIGTGIGSSSTGYSKKIHNQKNKAFKDEDFKKQDEELDLHTLNTLNQTELNKNHVSLNTDINEDLFATKLDTLDNLGQSKPKIDEIDEKELLALYEEENNQVNGSTEEQNVLNAQIEELNNLSYEEDFSNKKIKQELDRKTEDFDDPLLKQKLEELNQIYAESKENAFGDKSDLVNSSLLDNLDLNSLDKVDDKLKDSTIKEKIDLGDLDDFNFDDKPFKKEVSSTDNRTNNLFDNLDVAESGSRFKEEPSINTTSIFDEDDVLAKSEILIDKKTKDNLDLNDDYFNLDTATSNQKEKDSESLDSDDYLDLEEPKYKSKKVGLFGQINNKFKGKKSSSKENDLFDQKNDNFTFEEQDDANSLKPEDFVRNEKDFDDELDLFKKDGGKKSKVTTNSVDIDSLSSLQSELNGNLGKRKKSYKKDKGYNKGIGFKSKLAIFGTTLVLGLGAVGTSLKLIDSSKEIEKEAIKSNFTLYGQSKDISQNIKEYLSGNKESEKKLMSLLSKSSEGVAGIRDITQKFNNENINTEIALLESSLRTLKKSVESNKDTVELNKQNEILASIVESSTDNMKVISKNIYKIYQGSEQRASQSELNKISELEKSLTSMYANTKNIVSGNNLDSSLNDLSNERNNFKNILLEIAKGNQKDGIREILLFPEAVPEYNKLAIEWRNLLESLDNVIKSKENINKVSAVNKQIEASIAQINKSFSSINGMLDGSADSKMNLYLYILLGGILSVAISSIILILGYKKHRKIQEEKLLQESEENKSAIAKLVNELVYLRTGDLTKRTTVDESITTDIADAINATMESLSTVVRKIQASSTLVNNKTTHINKLAENLLTSTEVQSNSIVEVSKSISEIARDISAISEKTKLSLNTAKNSQDASMLGLETVKESVQSMSVISENMNETVILMKKVSDSSKQISEVIGLLSDITEETNILALNATVQAAKAGEAGKGFKVVADAIQELADNAAEATRRVGALIATVQTDIQSVGLSIDKTTKEVQKGVELSENVGNQLDKIAEISTELADIIKSVTADTNENAATAKKLTQNMNNILKLTEKTKDSARDTTQAISDIEKVSSELSNSVQSFVVK